MAARVALDDSFRAAAAEERGAATIEPWTIDGAATRWTEDVQRPFTRNKTAVHNGATRGDMVNRRLCKNVETEYTAVRPPTRLDVELAAAALQLLALPRGREPWGAPLVGFWVAHTGLAFALEAFIKSLWNRTCVVDSGAGARELKVVPQRTLEDLFAARTDRALHAAWLGANDAAREHARQKAEQLRHKCALLERSAIASCVLEPAWIDADLREHAQTKARAMFSPEALLLASSVADVAAYLAAQSEHDLAFYPVWNPYADRRGNIVVAGYAYAERFGVPGLDIACQRLQRELAGLDNEHKAAAAANEIIALLGVIGCARDHAPAVEAAIAAVDLWELRHPADCADPRPVAYKCLFASPALAVATLRTSKKRWVKNVVEQLERRVDGGTGEPDAWSVFSAWQINGYPGEASPLTQLATTADPDVARRLAALVRTWPREHHIARAMQGVDVLARIDCELALVHLGLMAHASESTTLHLAAWRALEEVAAGRGLTADQLLDRAVPGAAIKEDAAAVTRLHVARLEIAMGTGRRWSGAEHRDFVRHPLIAPLAGGVLWGCYDGDRLATAFRVDDEAVAIADDASIGVVHPLQLTVADRTAWRAQLRTPAFAQLDRPLVAFDTPIDRLAPRTVKTTRLLGLLARGWRQEIDLGLDMCMALIKPLARGAHFRLPLEDGLAPEGSEDVSPIQYLNPLELTGTADPASLCELARDIQRLGSAD